MPTIERRYPRIDYFPCPAAAEALSIAGDIYPDHTQAALLDRLVIVGISALLHEHRQWRAPQLWGKKRSEWKLPTSLQNPEIDR